MLRRIRAPGVFGMVDGAILIIILSVGTFRYIRIGLVIIIGVGAAAEADDDDEEETTGWDEWEACGTRGETTRVFDDDGDQAEEEEEEEEEAAAADEDEDGEEALIIFLGEFPSCCGL